MAVDTFIPEIWNAQVITALEKSLVLAQPGVTVNTDYEGDIAQAGDTVHIGTLADPSIADYVKNTTVIDPATLSTTDQVLTITQSKYFAFELDDVDARQTINGGALLSTAAQRAAYKLAELADTFVGGLMTAGAGTILTAGDAATADAAYKIVVKLKLALDKKNVPQAGRFLTVSPDFYALVLQDSRFIDASQYGSNRAITTGEVGSILGFTVKVSTNLPEGTAGTAGEVSNFVIAGTSQGCTFAQQINKTEAYRPQNSFSDAIKGLHLYGGKVVRPEFLAVMDVDVTVA